MAMAALLGAASLARAEEEQMREITGTLSYLQRIALPPGAEVRVEARGLRDVVLGESAFVTAGEQVPLAFALSVPASVPVRLTATVLTGEGPSWAGGPVAVAAGATAAGEVRLAMGGLPVAMLCGEVAVLVRFDGAGMEITAPQGVLQLAPVAAASGARFEAPGDPSTWFWSKGETASLAISGEELPECGPRPRAYGARGNEPFWSVAVTGDQAVLTTLEGVEASGTLGAPVWRDGAVEWATADGGLRLRMTETLCRDTMTGMPHPETVTLVSGSSERQGCGGDPLSLLTGPEWVVEDIGGRGLIDNALVTVGFGEDGSLAGTGGCNRYAAGVTLTGEGLSIGPAAATMMACTEAVMRQEKALFDALAGVAAFDIDATGALLLRDAGGTALVTARR
jgi:heat shock protein HslJ